MPARLNALSRLKPLTLAVVSALIANSASAAWDMYPEATAEYGYEDNIRLSPPEFEDKASTGAVEGRVIVRNVGETHSVQTVMGLRQNTFWGTDLKDSTTGTVRISADKRGERLSYGIVGNYQNQPLLRFGAIDLSSGEVVGDAAEIQLDLLNAPEANQDLDYGFIEEEFRRQFFQVTPNARFQLSQRGSLSFSGSFYGAAYDSKAEAFGLEDYTGYGVGTQYSHQLSERNSVHVGVNFDSSEPDQSAGSDRLDGVVGFSRQVSETTSVLFEGGVGRVESETGRTDTVPVYRATLESRLERGFLRLSAGRDNWPTGFGNNVETDTLGAEWGRSITERVGFRLRANYLKANSNLDQGVTFEDREYADVEGRVSYSVTPAWAVGAAYRYRWTDREVDNRSSSGNAALFFVSYAPPRPF